MKTAEKLFRRAHEAQAGGNLSLAIRLYKDVLKEAPSHLDATYLLGTAEAMTGALTEAVATLRKAAELGPGSPMIRSNLGLALKLLGRMDEAEEAFRKALALDPSHPQAANNLAALLVARGRPGEAECLVSDILRTHPDASRYALIQLANAQADQARVPDALDSLESLLRREPDNRVAWSNFLSLLHYDPGRTRDEILEAHRQWGQRYPTTPPRRRTAGRRKRVRVGYLSPDFRTHPVGLLVAPVIAGHDPGRVEVFLYHDSTGSDAVTERLKGIQGVNWREVAGMPDAGVANRIRSDEIDVLVDLTGHLSGNRLPVFAARPAPVQGTWLGYPGSTGLAAMDFAISDEAFDPPAEGNAGYTERVIRVSRPAFCYTPPDDAPPVGSLPHGPLRFGSFNNLRKLNDDVIAVWARLLARVPESVLVMQARALGDTGVRRSISGRFRERGIGEERLELHPTGPLAEHLGLVSGTHLCLDPWPWNGHMTTLNCLWMGVPVVTLAGDRRSWRMGRCVLAQVDLAGLVADSREAYIEIAAATARDVPRMRDLRSSLRGRLAESVLTDGASLATELERIYVIMIEETS